MERESLIVWPFRRRPPAPPAAPKFKVGDRVLVRPFSGTRSVWEGVVLAHDGAEARPYVVRLGTVVREVCEVRESQLRALPPSDD